jgi:predicted RNA-binding Zn ribbon-like protein
MEFTPAFFVGGLTCLDFCNTFDHLHQPPKYDYFPDPVAVVDWGKAAGILPRKSRLSSRNARKTYVRMLETRALLYRLLQPLTHSGFPAESDLAAFNKLFGEASGSLQLVPGKTGFSLVSRRRDPIEQVMVAAIRSAADLMLTLRPENIRLCAECGWIFHDTSRNHLRRWCSMKICGNRAKAHRHYERTRQQKGGAAAR